MQQQPKQQQHHHQQQQQQQQQQPQQQQPQQQAQLLTDLVAGMVTSGVYTSLTYPVHRVKILLQTQDANPRILSGKVPRYSFVHSFGRLAREQGVLGLWRGNTPYLLRHVPSISMSFAFKDAFREALPCYDASSSPFSALAANAAAGAAAGALSLAVVYPFEFATIRLAADLGTGAADRQYGNGMLSAWLQAVRSEGPLSCYQGFSVAVISMAAYKALYFGPYDTAKNLLLPEDGRYLEITPSAVLGRTALAASTTFMAASITYPLDIIRKRLVVDVGSESSTRQHSGSFKAAVSRIYAREGLKGFYRFYSYDMVFRLGGGVLLVGYDLLKSKGAQRQEDATTTAAGATADAAGAGRQAAAEPAEAGVAGVAAEAAVVKS
ncbi:mitochondrial carrier domain-containing protein [Scenedesmus sp. NREL 46B-D3]|nr:mitochondrial carrier domain-containing protein [Scenedesmus sp. NREL 46B-D3]